MTVLPGISYLQLVACAVSPAILAILLHYLLKKWKWFQKQKYWLQQLMIGLVFSLVALCSFYFGVDYKAIQNELYKDVVGNFGSANASPLIAGLVFGGPSGLIAGFAAGIYRLFIYGFGVGDYLRAAECITVLLSGAIAWLLRATLFDNKKPKWFYGLIIGMLIETTHMLLIFAVAIAQVDSVYAYGIIRVCDIPCFVTVGMSITIALVGIALLEKEKLFDRVKGGDKRIATKIQKWLGLTFAISLLVTFTFTYWGNYQKTAYDVGENLDNGNRDIKMLLENNTYVSAPTITPEMSNDEVKTASQNSGAFFVTRFQRIGKQGFTILLDANTQRIISVPLYDDGSSGLDENIGEVFDIKGKFSNQNKYYETPLGQDNIVHYIKWDHITKSAKGEVNFISIACISRSEARLEMGIVVRLTSYLELLVFIGIFGVIYTFIKRVVVSNVIKINESLDKITGGNLNTKVNVRSNKEFSDLSDDINETVDTLKHFIDEANKRIDAELKYAKEIQQSQLPIIFPTTKAYDLFASMHTAKQVGGDFYDFFPVDDKHLFFLMADVSGKGIPAAMFMMRSKTLVKSLVQTNELTLDQIITGVNDELNRDNNTGMFVTAWFGILNIETGDLEYVNAGHCNPLVGKPGKYEYIHMIKNCVLGVIPGINYKLEKIKLKPNEGIILYTDGVTEATSKKKKLFGEPKLLEVVNNATAKTSKDMLEVIHKEVDKFQHGAEQADDITMLMVRFKPKK